MPSIEFHYPIPLEYEEENKVPHNRGQYLYFKANHARLFLGKALKEARYPTWKTCPTRLVDYDERVVGSVRLNVDAYDELSVGEACEVIALSSGTAEIDGDYDGVIDEWGVLEELLERQELEASGAFQFYNVMWVEYIENIAYRKAIGTVYKAAWESQHLELIDVILG